MSKRIAGFKAAHEEYIKVRDAHDKAQHTANELQSSMAVCHRNTQVARAEMYRQAVADGIITKDLIDVLAPNHERNSCDEVKLNNARDGCDRCTMLKALTDPWILNEDVELQLRIVWDLQA